jgi:protein SCO1/2
MRVVAILGAGLLACLLILGVRWSFQRFKASEQAPDEPAISVREDHDLQAAPESFSGDPLMRPRRKGEPVLDATLVDQDGREFKLSDFRGQKVVLTFLYTHCNVASMCPLTTRRLAEAHRRLAADSRDEVQFVVASFDTKRDTPEELRAYAARHDLNVPAFTFATGTQEQVDRLSRSLNTYYRPDRLGYFDHNIVVTVIDENGIIREWLFGTKWTLDELLSALNKSVSPSRSVLPDHSNEVRPE